MFRVLNSTGLSLSEPIDYYVHWAFIMQGVLPASIFAVTVITTGSILCGLSLSPATEALPKCAFKWVNCGRIPFHLGKSPFH